MAFVISNGWDVAHHHIHESFEHIGKSIVANLGISNTFTEVRDNASWAKCLGLSTQVRAAFIAENKEAIKATVLFQAGRKSVV